MKLFSFIFLMQSDNKFMFERSCYLVWPVILLNVVLNLPGATLLTGPKYQTGEKIFGEGRVGGGE